MILRGVALCFGKSFAFDCVEVKDHWPVIVLCEGHHSYCVWNVMAVKWPPILYPKLVEYIYRPRESLEEISCSRKNACAAL